MHCLGNVKLAFRRDTLNSSIRTQNMTPLERITERVTRHGDVNEPTTPRPLLTLAEFFEGNEVICCNGDSTFGKAISVGSCKKVACSFFRVEVRAGRLSRNFFNLLG